MGDETGRCEVRSPAALASLRSSAIRRRFTVDGGTSASAACAAIGAAGCGGVACFRFVT